MMKVVSDRILLQDGNAIPAFGFGCFNAFGAEMTQAVSSALDAGYRYFDSAARYQNETEIGNALADCEVGRDELFVLSKVWPARFDEVEESFSQTLKELRVEYLDCLLLHWPGIDETRRLKAYEKMLDLQRKGLIKSVGVSNFQPDQLEVIKAKFGAYPVVNEIEIHPSYQQRELCTFCHEKRIQLIAYSPINRGAYMKNPTVLAIGDHHNKTPNQVVLRWHVQKGQIPIPKSTNPERQKENIDVFDFQLTPEEMQQLAALECGARIGQDPLTFNG